jgi:16S rRNA C1402 (ribose-2'-O) methylase RsmI
MESRCVIRLSEAAAETHAIAEAKPLIVEGSLTEAEQSMIAATEAKMQRKLARTVSKRPGASQSSASLVESSVQESTVDEVCFAGRRPPKDKLKRQLFDCMVNTYRTTVTAMRSQGKMANIKTNLQKDFWTCVKNTIGDVTDFHEEQIKQLADKWAEGRFTD